MKSSVWGVKSLLAVTIMGMIIMTTNYASAQTAYGGNNTSYNYETESYQQVQNQIRTLLLEKQMQENATKWMTASQENNKDFITKFVSQNSYPTVSVTTSLQIEKRNMAYGQSGYRFADSMTNYDSSMRDQTRALLAEVKDYNSEKIVPSYTSCIAFHDCVNPQFTPVVDDQEKYMTKTNATTTNPYQLKPEFANDTGYILTNPTWIKNMTDLQFYMTHQK